MDRIKQMAGRMSLILFIFMLASCAGIFSKFMTQHPAALKRAISLLTTDLLNQVKEDWDSSGRQGQIRIMLVPFMDRYSGEVPEVSRNIEKIIIEKGRQYLKDVRLERLTSKNLSVADYIIDGVVGLDSLKTVDPSDPERHFHVSAIVRNLEKIRIIGKSDAWISDLDLNYRPAGIHRDSPLYIKDKRLKNLTNIEKNHNNNRTDEEYFDSLEIKATWIEAETAYEERDYQTALSLFEKASINRDGQVLRTYIGLYLTHQKLGNWDETEKALAKIVSISVEKYNMLTFKFVFDVNSVSLWGDEGRYDVWLRQIGKYFQGTHHCLKIVGHCSNTGPETWNNRLSLDRAEFIRKRLQESFSEVMQRSRTIGKGFSENIVGIGTDDERDALDRRVEIIIVGCGEI
ncbi:hypothetical protein QUF80_16580 [Desulfococcaceae bacterium HSG8]|nr:hypothetical protein [Desulfococcaceae bacterium HSG8]